MATQASVLVLDDGELDDVCALLDEFGADYVRLRGGAIPERVEPPRDLFVATNRRAMIAKTWNTGMTGVPTPTKIGIVTEDSNTLRNMLRRIGFDYLVRRPVHPYALRLLMLRALYRGAEKRREQRITIGSEISYRTGLRRRTAILADLSMRGCRLLLPRDLPAGSRITLQIPRELTGSKPLSLRAIAVRTVNSAEASARGEYAVGLAFEKVTPETRQIIDIVMKARATSPAVLDREIVQRSALVKSSEAAKPVSTTPVAGPASDANRRKHRRASFEREVVMLDDEAGNVLVGRDLSVGGMYVDPQDGLEAGREMELAIYGAAREEPFIVRARVLRVDAEGAALTFDGLSTEAAQRLEALVGNLPSVESLDAGETQSVGTVVSRILESESDIG